MMKKFISLVIIPTLLFDLVGPGILYSIMMRTIKELKKTAILFVPESEITILELSENDKINSGTWFYPNDFEICFNGKMYDILKSETDSGKVIVYCVLDGDEDNLTESFNKSSNSKPGKEPSSSDYLSLLKLMYGYRQANSGEKSLYTRKGTLEINDIFLATLPDIQDIPTPPPQYLA